MRHLENGFSLLLHSVEFDTNAKIFKKGDAMNKKGTYPETLEMHAWDHLLPCETMNKRFYVV